MKLSSIIEANIARPGTAAGIGKAIGGEIASAATDEIPGMPTAKAAGRLTLAIIKMLKHKKRATKWILQAMSLPDSDRDELNIFDIDDDLWGPDGLLSEQSKTQILDLVEKELNVYVAKRATLPPNFANTLAIKFVQSKLKKSA